MLKYNDENVLEVGKRKNGYCYFQQGFIFHYKVRIEVLVQVCDRSLMAAAEVCEIRAI